ncbi:sugar ABC transporter permease [Clostridia bacterium]|nr:sugar ABC transporter permease [Clostridia bacterium]
MVQNSVQPSLRRRRYWLGILRNWQLYVFIAPAFIYVLIFNYFPMYGVQLAFKTLSLRVGITRSPWVQPIFKYFTDFFASRKFTTVITNTLLLNLYGLAAGFPFPIILAVLLNEHVSSRYRKLVQNVTYAPYFISTVVMVGIIKLFFAHNGIINSLTGLLGAAPVSFLNQGSFFKHLYTWTGIWQRMGYDSIIYFAALSGVSPELHEAAIMDGASRLKRVWHISLPHIRPTIVILLVLNCAYLMNIGFEKIYLMQNAINIEYSEVFSTYIYNLLVKQPNYGLGAAVGLFQNGINIIIMLIVNWFANRISGTSLF